LGGVSAPVKTARATTVVKAVEQIPAGFFCAAAPGHEGAVIEAIKRERAEVLAVERAKVAGRLAEKGGDFLAAARPRDSPPGRFPLFSRAEPPKESGALRGNVLLAALQTAAGKMPSRMRRHDRVRGEDAERSRGPAGLRQASGRSSEKQTLEQKRSQVLGELGPGAAAATKVDLAAGLAAPRPAEKTRGGGLRAPFAKPSQESFIAAGKGPALERVTRAKALLRNQLLLTGRRHQQL